MCWAERVCVCVCAESITNNNDSRRKFVHVFFGSAIVSGLWNLVHRSTNILVFLSTSLYLLSLALTLSIVSFQFLPLLFLFLVFIRWPNHVPFGLLTFDWIGQHSFRKTMWHLRYLYTRYDFSKRDLHVKNCFISMMAVSNGFSGRFSIWG